jgi:hypothetical protein
MSRPLMLTQDIRLLQAVGSSGLPDKVTSDKSGPNKAAFIRMHSDTN